MPEATFSARFPAALRGCPDARAVLSGSRAYPALRGSVDFYQTDRGVLAVAEVRGLPGGEGRCGARVFALHIHSGGSCTGNAADPFADAGTHYDPAGCPHPAHAGDLPPLFSNHGYAFQAALTDRITVREILGRTVILHARPDDFTSQPGGNAGAKIACGRIVPVRAR